MNRSIVSKKALGLIAVILAVAASATTVFAQEGSDLHKLAFRARLL
jgi:hypothetical protein